MYVEFNDDETGYRAWLAAHPGGFVANMDKRRKRAEYPMVHRSSRKCVTSPNRENYTTGDYFKVCAEDIEALEKWSALDIRRPLTRCGRCM